jgi:predicted Zn-dependent peptidase
MGTTYSAVYVSTTDPDSATKTIIREIKKVKQVGFSKDELRDKKEQFLTRFYMGQQTNSSQATTLAVYEMRGEFSAVDDFVSDVYAIKLDELNRVFRKHTKAIRWFYLGKQSQAPKYIHLEPGRPE